MDRTVPLVGAHVPVVARCRVPAYENSFERAQYLCLRAAITVLPQGYHRYYDALRLSGTLRRGTSLAALYNHATLLVSHVSWRGQALGANRGKVK